MEQFLGPAVIVIESLPVFYTICNFPFFLIVQCLEELAVFSVALALENFLAVALLDLEWVDLLELVLLVVEDVRHCGRSKSNSILLTIGTALEFP